MDAGASLRLNEALHDARPSGRNVNRLGSSSRATTLPYLFPPIVVVVSKCTPGALRASCATG